MAFMPTPAPATSQKTQAGPAMVRLDDIAAFRPGTWNGDTVTLQDMKDMVDNFKRYSTGENPYYRPFVSINHDDVLNCGFVDKCNVGPDGIMKLSAWNVPSDVGEWVKQKRLNAPSIEFWRPKRDASGKVVEGFVKPDGQYSETPVLRCVTLLGNDAPAVKGLGDLPSPTRQFSQTGKVSRFRSEFAMDRAAMLQALQSMGFDVSKITDQVPDEVIKGFLDFVQSMAQPGTKPNPEAPTTPSATPSTMSDADKDKDKDGDPMKCADLSSPAPMAGAGTPAAAPAAGFTTPGSPSSVTLKFRDSAGKEITAVAPMPGELSAFVAQQQTVLNRIIEQGKAVAADLKRQRDAAKGAAIKAFCDRMKGRYTPAQLAAISANLNVLDHDTPRKFSDGSRVGTALEESISLYEAAAGPSKFAEKMPQTPTGSGGGLTPERKAAILKGDPMFSPKKSKA